MYLFTHLISYIVIVVVFFSRVCNSWQYYHDIRNTSTDVEFNLYANFICYTVYFFLGTSPSFFFRCVWINNDSIISKCGLVLLINRKA